MWAVRRKWLCLFKLSTLSHVGQFSGNENPTPPPPLTPLQVCTALLPHSTPNRSEWAAVFWRLRGCLGGPTVLRGGGWRAMKGGRREAGKVLKQVKASGMEERWRWGSRGRQRNLSLTDVHWPAVFSCEKSYKSHISLSDLPLERYAALWAKHHFYDRLYYMGPTAWHSGKEERWGGGRSYTEERWVSMWS